MSLPRWLRHKDRAPRAPGRGLRGAFDYLRSLYAAAGHRSIIRLRIKRPTQQPQVYRFQADRWQHFRILCAAGQMNFQQLDSTALVYENQPTLVVIRTNVEGVRWWKVDSPAPAVSTAIELPFRVLRPFEITDDYQWSQGSRPAIVVSNVRWEADEIYSGCPPDEVSTPYPTQDVKVDVFYATREEDQGQGGGGPDF